MCDVDVTQYTPLFRIYSPVLLLLLVIIMQLSLLLFFLISTVYVNSWSLEVINQVNACPGRSYCTLKLFTANWQQKDLCQGTSSILIDRNALLFRLLRSN